jgi:hypothetical protein
MRWQWSGGGASHEHCCRADHGLCGRFSACLYAVNPAVGCRETTVVIHVDRHELARPVSFCVQAEASVDAQGVHVPYADTVHAGGRDEIALSQAACHEAHEEADHHCVFHLDDRTVAVTIKYASEGDPVAAVHDRGVARVRSDGEIAVVYEHQDSWTMGSACVG